MLFLDHSSPRQDMHSQEAWFLENSQFFSPSYSSPSHAHSHSHSQFLSPSPSQVHLRHPHSATHLGQHQGFNQHVSPTKVKRRRRMSGDEHEVKKLRAHGGAESGLDGDGPKKGERWPTFQLPQGGVVQQSPFGMIKITDEGSSQKAVIDNGVSLQHFQQGGGDKAQDFSMPSPSAEAEGYMVDGYRGLTNKSYHLHEEDIISVNYSLYDLEDEDAHIDDDLEM